jgi:hypothetical protein
MTSKAALQTILGEHDRAMSTLNEVIRSDPNHYLALIRRSQVYKKVVLLALRKASSTVLLPIWKWWRHFAPIICRSLP